ncbi:MAG: hypothetical protein ACSHXK_05655 [Oceanococcus sp.]
MTSQTETHTAASPRGFAVGKPSASGGIGAPPCNTAPSKDNGIDLPVIEVLHQGIDSLYLSFPGTLDEYKELLLSTLKANAKEFDALTSSLCVYKHQSLTFAVKDRGVGMFAFVLFNENYNIRLSSSRSKQLPLASVQISSKYLLEESLTDIADELVSLFNSLGDLEDDPVVSRVDICVDFVALDNLFALPRRAWVGRARNFHQHWTQERCTGWSIGLKAPLSARLYDKTTEIELTNKLYMHDLWLKAGWTGELPVYRLEFQFKRQVLQDLSVRFASDLLSSTGPLWRYAMDWLRLCVPTDSDTKRSRWPSHPAWEALSKVEWFEDELDVAHRLRPTHSQNQEWAVRNFRASIVNYMAHKRLEDPYKAVDELFEQILVSCEKEAKFGEKTTLSVLEDRARKKASHWGKPFASAVRASKHIETKYTASKYRHRK